MKTSRAALFSVISLSLALCACDKKPAETTAPPPPPPPKESATAPAENAQPPVSTEAPKEMTPSAPVDATASGKVSGLDAINGAIKMSNNKKSAEMMGKQGPMGSKLQGAAAKEAYQAKAKKGGAAGVGMGVSSLDDLVSGGFLKSIPEAPEGKKWVLDKQKQEVRVENK